MKESEIERLLGFLVNNVMTWEHHLYGNEEAVPEIKNNMEVVSSDAQEEPQDDG